MSETESKKYYENMTNEIYKAIHKNIEEKLTDELIDEVVKEATKRFADDLSKKLSKEFTERIKKDVTENVTREIKEKEIIALLDAGVSTELICDILECPAELVNEVRNAPPTSFEWIE